MTEFAYAGAELGIFAQAKRWKSYYGSLIRPYLGQRVLEVGAGIGATTLILHDGHLGQWLCLEPDARFTDVIDRQIREGSLPPSCRTRLGTVATLEATDTFDTILYIDVLEHIESDDIELQSAASHLNQGGSLIVLSPAHQWLFTPFDRLIGHYRRYSKAALAALGPECCSLKTLWYLDSAGLLLSLANRLFLRQSMPTAAQIASWDKWFVPISVRLDSALGFSIGKSVLAIWMRN